MATNQCLTEQGVIEITVTAAEDLSAKQYYIVKLNSSGNAALSGLNEKSAGILQNKPASGEPAIIRIAGMSLLKIAEAVTFGKFLTPTAAGKGEVCDNAGEEFVAKAFGTYAADDLAIVQIVHGEVEGTDA